MISRLVVAASLLVLINSEKLKLENEESTTYYKDIPKPISKFNGRKFSHEAREAAASAEKSLFLAKEEADNHAATARFIGKPTKQVKPSTRYPQQLTIPRPQDRAFDAAEQAALDAESEAQEAALASQKQLALAKKQAALAAANANKSVRVLTKTKKSASKDPKKVIRIKEYSNVGQ